MLRLRRTAYEPGVFCNVVLKETLYEFNKGYSLVLARVQLNPLLRKCVPGCHHERRIVLDQADGPTVLQVVEALNLPAEEPSNITSRVDPSPGKPKRAAADTGFLILAKMIGGG